MRNPKAEGSFRELRPIGLLLICLCGIPLSPNSTLGAEPVLFYARFGHDTGGCFGSAASGGYDLDGDGLADFIVGEPNTCPGGTFASGSIFAYSGLTGNLLYRARGASVDNDKFGTAVTFVDDLDGDGIADFAGGAPGSGSVYVYSGMSGSLLYRRDGNPGYPGGGSLGFSVAGLQDLDGDGRGDLLAGAPAAANNLGVPSGVAILFSGATGEVLRTIEGEGNGDRFGEAVASAGDLDGDGASDFLISAPNLRNGGTVVGAVYVYSGASGTLLYRVDGPVEGLGGLEYGVVLAGLGDITGDGRSDFAVGAPNQIGSVFVYSGATGSLIRRIDAVLLDEFGSSLAGSDINGDGMKDLIVGAPEADENGVSFSGTVFVYSGSDWSLLLKVDGTIPYEELGGTVASPGDTNGDQREDLFLGAPSTTIYGKDFTRGTALLYGLADVLPARAFSGSEGLTLRLAAGSEAQHVQIEPIGGSYLNTDVWLETIVLRRAIDPVHEIEPTGAWAAEDLDGNGMPEVGVQFARSDLRNLLGVHTEIADTVTVAVEATTRSGGRVRALTLAHLISTVPATVTAFPNPMRGAGSLSFITTTMGPLKTKLFDTSGRLVRVLVDEALVQAGYHDVAIDGRGSRGEPLASGIYFYEVESADGRTSGRVAILR